MKSFKTPKGTELPILNLRGKDYLQVQQRLVWFREERPEWSIETEFLERGPDHAMAKATIKDDSGRIIATSHKLEDKKGFPDYHEKCETGAIGRALALCGFGTQFCADELDEGDRLADAPRFALEDAPQSTIASAITAESAGMYEIRFGKKYNGRMVNSITLPELKNFHSWLKESSQKGKGLTPDAHAAMVNIEIYLDAHNQ